MSNTIRVLSTDTPHSHNVIWPGRVLHRSAMTCSDIQSTHFVSTTFQISAQEWCHVRGLSGVCFHRQYQHIRAYSLQLSAEKRNRGATTFWTRLANGTNGVRIELDHSDNMVGLAVMATVYSEQGPEHFKVST